MIAKAKRSRGITHWLIVESPGNWEADRKRGFTSLGVSERFRRAASSMRKGDILISYVSKAGAFADLRRVESDAPKQASDSGGYDRLFPLEVKTSSVIALERGQWISVKELLEDLEFTRGKPNWSWVFRTSIKLLDEADGKRLAAEVRKAARGVKRGNRESQS